MRIDRSVSLKSWEELDKSLWKIRRWAVEQNGDPKILKETDKAIFLLRYFFAEIIYEDKKSGLH